MDASQPVLLAEIKSKLMDTDADAYFGLDDLREWCLRQHTQIPIYLNRPTYDNVAASFPYLVDSSIGFTEDEGATGTLDMLGFHV